MFQLPHRSDEADRLPWATYGIAVLLVLLFVSTQVTARRRVHQGLSQLDRALAFHGEHSGLRLDPRLRPFQPPASSQAEPGPGARGRSQAGPRFKALEQVELDGITRGGFDTLAATPLWRWGVVPAHFSPLDLFAYPLLHGGFLPLVCNVIFLLLCGPTLEADWGRHFHLGFLWVSAAIGGAAFSLANLSLDAALVGSSAAVAALVTAFLFRHWGRALQPFAWVSSPRWNAFRVSSPCLLALWLVREAATPLAPDLVALPGVGWSVLWADAGGVLFAAGLLAALRWGGLEERYWGRTAPPRSGRKERSPAPAPLAAPGAPLGAPSGDPGWAQLLRSARESPRQGEALADLWEVAVETGRTGEAAPLLLQRIRDGVHGTDPREAFEHWGRLRQQASATGLPLSLETRLAEALETAGHPQEALEVLQAATARATPDTAPTTLARLLRLASGPERARVAGMAQAAAAGSPELQAELARPLPAPSPAAPAAPRDAAEPEPSGPRPGPAEGGLRPVPARPLALRDGVMTLELDTGDRRALRLSRARGVAAAAVDGDGAEANLVLDIFLEIPTAAGNQAKSLRLDTHRFDPRALVPTESEPEDALLSLAGAVLTASGASWLLGESAHRLRRYPSLAAYERDLLTVLRLGCL